MDIVNLCVCVCVRARDPFQMTRPDSWRAVSTARCTLLYTGILCFDGRKVLEAIIIPLASPLASQWRQSLRTLHICCKTEPSSHLHVAASRSWLLGIQSSAEEV